MRTRANQPIPLQAIVAVTNDLTTDQRVDRTCKTLQQHSYSVLLVGRRRTKSLTLAPRSYQTHRMQLLFEKGPLFYAEFNLRLFFFLIFRSHHLLVSNDLDTLPATYFAHLVSRMIFFFSFSRDRGAPLHLHDCHEYFRGVPELVGRKFAPMMWKALEDMIFPHLKRVIAVNTSIARIYNEEYGVPVTAVRNLPFRKPLTPANMKKALQIGENRKVIYYQGAVNVDRGLEEAVCALQYLKTDAVLVIVGTGDIFHELQSLIVREKRENQVILTGPVPFEKLHEYTQMADVGLSIEKDIGINYHYALPNKIMDYIQANVPLLVSPFPEMKTIVEGYRIGACIAGHDPESLAGSIDAMLGNPLQLEQYKENLKLAAEELCWENEQHKLSELLNLESV